MTALPLWEAALRRHPIPSPDVLAAFVAAGARYGALPVCVHRTPAFLPSAELAAWQRRLARFHRVIRVVRAALLADLDQDDHSLAARLGIPRQARAWAALDPGYLSAAPLARLDTFEGPGPDGPRTHFVELNAEAPAGMGYATALASVFTADPAFVEVTSALPLRHLDPVPPLRRTLVGIARERALRLGVPLHRPHVAIVDRRGGGTAPELVLLRDRLRATGLPVEVVDPDELSFDGEILRAGDFPVDLVYRRILVKDLLSRPATALLAAYEAGRVCMVNPLRTALLHNKGVFALLRDPTIPLEPSDRAFVDRFVPDTHVLRTGDDGSSEPAAVTRAREAALVAARRSPEDWVLKPLEDHGGSGVVLGWQSPRAAWEAAVDGATHHVLQRRIPSGRGTFYDLRDDQPHERLPGLDPFLCRGRLAGFLCRVAEGELANVTAGGASQVPVFVAG